MKSSRTYTQTGHTKREAYDKHNDAPSQTSNVRTANDAVKASYDRETSIGRARDSERGGLSGQTDTEMRSRTHTHSGHTKRATDEKRTDAPSNHCIRNCLQSKGLPDELPRCQSEESSEKGSTNVHIVSEHPTAIIGKTAQAGCNVDKKGWQVLKPLTSTQPRIHISEIFHDFEHEAQGIPEKPDALVDTLNSVQEEPTQPKPSLLEKVRIEGSPALQEMIKGLVLEYKDIFSDTLTTQPALVEPMVIEADRQKWNSSTKNKGPPRQQTLQKQQAILKQVTQMQELGIIQVSNAASYSQVHMVPKGDNEWRTTIDYVLLNDCTENAGWRVPNIGQMLIRIGQQRPTIFAVMDLTSGYHQAPLSASSRILTAFICALGIFEYTRVAMGLKGAPSYFQQLMTTVVLAGLVMIICEVYLDDIIVFGKTNTEFIDRLRQVFGRLRKHKITLNPKKCIFGVPSVEYVGHTIDSTGLSFSREKIDGVLMIPPPKSGKDLRSFLGVVGYFRDHIANHSTLVHPLYELYSNWEKTRRMEWTPEATDAFTAVRKAINECPTLFFVDDSSPIVLHTDASDYGIGAYCFQVVEGQERPIAFVSKSLTSTEQRWTTIEKECYAIVYAFRKLEYLLRDAKFTLRTDHANLTYINDPPSPKVRRWKLAIQEHDFYIEHIKGELNVAADAFSRLLPIEENQETVASIREETINVIQEFRIPNDQYRTISDVHNSVVGHHGVERTLNKLRQLRHEWPMMREIVKQFIRKCPCCQKMSYLKTPIHTHPYTLACYSPMERIYIDTISFETPDEDGNKHVLVIIDAFTRWIELYPLTNLSAQTSAKALLQHFGRFGQPTQLVSDNGTQFVNEVHSELLALIGIQHTRTTPYSSESNGIVERANKEVLRHTRNLIFEKRIMKDWAKALPFVMRILNSTTKESTGASPAELLFGRAINLDRNIFDVPDDTARPTQSLGIWASDNLNVQQILIDKAASLQKKKDDAHIAAADPKRTEFKRGDYVLCEHPNQELRRGAPNKLAPVMKGPMKVISNDKNDYILQDLVTGRQEKVHIKRLKAFDFDANLFDPMTIALTDRGEFFVESIQDHIGDPKLKSKMQFKVRWAGYDESEDTWEWWKELRDNVKLHKYLNSNGLEDLIPKEHRREVYI